MRASLCLLALSLCLGLSACCIRSIELLDPDYEAPRWQRSTGTPPRGVVLVAHGLNLRPSAMDYLCTTLNSRGFHTYRLSLSGHHTAQKETFPASKWMEDFAEAYRAAHASEPRLPIYIVAFSAGALLATHFLDSNPNLEPSPRGMVFLAPALSLRFLPQSAYILRWFGPLNLRVPNRAPSDYRRFRLTPLFWYENLIDLYEETRTLAQAEKLRPIPTLLLMSQDDELISFSGLEEWLEKNQLDTWRIVELKPEPTGSDLFKHLVIDERSLGVAQWREMVGTITTFLADTEGPGDPRKLTPGELAKGKAKSLLQTLQP